MNKKLKLVLSKMIVDNTQLHYGYDSASKEFSDKLASIGISLPIKLYIRYKFPNGQTPEQYERFANTFEFYDNYPDHVSHNLDNLTESERKELNDYILQQKLIHANMLSDVVLELVNLNPELRSVDIKPSKIIDFLKGAAYGFATEEIDYFINEYKGETDESAAFTRNMNNLLGFEPGYILSPKHREIILSAAQANHVARSRQNDNAFRP